MSPHIFADPVLGWLGPVPITRTMVTSGATSALLVMLSAVVARAVHHRSGGSLAATGRLTFRFVHDLAEETAGRASPTIETFAGSLFLFIAGSAVIGQLPGIPAPTSSLAATTALASVVFLAVPITGIALRGVRGYFAHYVRPNPLLVPLHVISELSRTVALALRLFGNMMSGHLVVALIVALVGPFVPVPLMALDLLIGLLQAYIFTVLAGVYLGAAIRVGGGE